MKKTIVIILSAVIINLAHSQTLENGINELKNENFIKAKQELLSVYNTNKAPLTAFYLGNTYMRLNTLDSAAYYYRLAETATDAFGYIAKARLAVMENKDSTQVKTLVEKAFSVSKRKNAEVFFQAGLLAYQPQAVNIRQFIPYMEDAHGMSPANVYYALTLGDMYLDLKQGGKAMGIYEEALAKEPNNVLTNIRIGRLYYSAINYDLAIQYLEKANSIDPGFSIVHKELGELYYLTKQYEKATAEFKRYIALNNNDSRAKITYGGFLYQLKEYKTAIDEVSVFLMQDSTNYIYHRILAYSYHETKKPKEAQNALNNFWKYAGSNKVTGMDYSYAGKIAAANKDTANAIKYFKTSVAMDTANADLQSEYALALYNAKRNKESIAEYKKRMMMVKPFSPLDYYYLGRAYFADGDFKNADTTFADFIRVQPKSPDGYLWRAKSNVEMEDAKSLKGLGVAYYEKYIELASTDVVRNKSSLTTAYFYLAYVALTQKDNAKAKAYFSKIIEIDPGNKNATEELKVIK